MLDEQFESLVIPKANQNEGVRKLFDEYAGLFGFDGSFGAAKVAEHEIKLKPGAKAVK